MKYIVYDGLDTRLLGREDTVIEAGTAREAIQKHLDKQGRGRVKFYNSGGGDVLWRTTPFIEREGRKILAGRISWWAIKPSE